MHVELSKPKHIVSLATSSVLVNLEVSVWSATKQDREISNEVTNSKHADQSAGRFVKNLLANNSDHKALLNYRQTMYNWMKLNTYDWSKAQSLLPAVALPAFMSEFHAHETEFNRLLDQFCANYGGIVSNMAFAQGTMFNRNDYPTVDEVRRKFNVRLFTSEVPLGDYRCQVSAELADDMNAHYTRQAQEIIERVMADQMDRLVDVMESISHCCGVDEFVGKDGEHKQKKRKIYEGTIDKAKELCSVYKQFNLTNDSRLDEVITELDMTLRGVNADLLRESDATRATVQKNVSDILSKFAPRKVVHHEGE